MAVDGTGTGTGRTIGDYLLAEEVGRGGMGVVYRARRLGTGETVAVKLMLPEVSANRTFRARFVREAMLSAALDHPNIVPVYDAGDTDGELYIAMKLIEGRDLKSVIEQEGRLDPKRALAIVRQVAAALDAAHEAGVVHHDVKPQNILVAERLPGENELVFVTDFGLVRPAGSESTASRTGEVFGSIQYMPPEQVEGMPADGRADVYALGCVLYECLTGEIPFDRPNEVAVLWAHVHEQPARVTDLRPELPGGLDAVVATAMAKHPDDRFLTCGEFVEELEKGLERKHRPVVMPVLRPLVRRIPRPKTEREVWAPNFFPELSRVRKLTDRTNWVQAAAVTAIVCLMAAALVQFGRDGGIPQAAADVAEAVAGLVDDEPSSDRIAAEPVDATRRRGNLRGAGALQTYADRASPSSREGGAHDSAGPYQEDQGPSRPTGAASPIAAANLPAPPRSAKIVWVQARDTLYGNVADVWVMRPDGTGQKRLTSSVADENWPDWSPDGTQIAYVKDGDIAIMNSDGSNQRVLGFCSAQRPCSEPDWSPDGKRLLFTQSMQTFAPTQTLTRDARVVVADLASGKLRPVPNLTAYARTSDGSVRNATWAPNGRLIAGRCKNAGARPVCVVRPDGTIKRRLQGSGVSLAWAPDAGSIAMERCPGLGDGLCLVPSGGGEPKHLNSGTSFDPSWSSDATEIVYSRWGEAERGEIYRIASDGATSVRLTHSPDVADIQPDWWGPAS